MCNDYEQHVAWAEYCKLMEELELGVPSGQSARDLPQTDGEGVGCGCRHFVRSGARA